MLIARIGFPTSEALARRLRQHYPAMEVSTGSNDPPGYDIAVNATPLGMKPDDPLPFDVNKIASGCFAGEAVMKEQHTPLLRAVAMYRLEPACCSR